MEFQTATVVHKIIFTIDGTEPTATNHLEYTDPITFTENTTLKVRSLTLGGRMSPVRTITIEKAEYAPAVRQVTDEGFAQSIPKVKAQHAKQRFRTSDELLAYTEFEVSFLKDFVEVKTTILQRIG